MEEAGNLPEVVEQVKNPSEMVEQVKNLPEKKIGILSEEEVEAIATKLNENFDLPLIGENKEQKILIKLVRELDKTLLEILPEELYELVKISAVGISIKEIGNLKKRLPSIINQKVNIPFLSEKVEGKIFKFFVELICDSLGKDSKVPS